MPQENQPSNYQQQRLYAAQSQITPQGSVQTSAGPPPKQVKNILDKHFIIPLVVVIVILIGVGLFLLLRPSEIETPPIVEEGGEGALAEELSLASLCDDLNLGTEPSEESAVLIDACRISEAVENNDAAVCNNIEFVSESIGKYSCVVAVAKNSNDVEICGEIPKDEEEYQVLCVSSLAFLNNNPNLCKENIEESGVVEECLYSYVIDTGDAKVCDEMKTDLKDSCISEVAFQNNDEALCDQVKDSYFKDSCILEVAISKKDDALCEAISDEEGLDLYDECVYEIAIESGDTELCEKLENPFGAYPPSNCRQEIADGAQFEI